MSTVNSAKGQITGVIPASDAIPVVHSDLLALANAIEPKLVLTFTDTTNMNAFASATRGMLATLTGSDFLYRHNGTTWVKIYPIISSGTAAPSGGSDGDIYIQY